MSDDPLLPFFDEPAPGADETSIAGGGAAEAPAARRDRSLAVLLLAVLGVLLAVGTAAIQGYRDLAEQHARELELERAIARTETDVRGLEERIGRLQKDPVTLERLARQELGLVRKGDLVLVFPEPPKR